MGGRYSTSGIKKIIIKSVFANFKGRHNAGNTRTQITTMLMERRVVNVSVKLSWLRVRSKAGCLSA
jgi:hypothetical protein